MKNVINSNSDGHRDSIPWLFTEQQRNVVKEVIRKIKFPTGFASNINNILTKKGEFGGVKTHDWHTFIKVIILLYFYIGIHLFGIFLFTFLLQYVLPLMFIMIPFLLQYVLPLSLPDNFDNNIKQVIYDLGKYMR
jgi:hypothetical protein